MYALVPLELMDHCWSAVPSQPVVYTGDSSAVSLTMEMQLPVDTRRIVLSLRAVGRLGRRATHCVARLANGSREHVVARR